MIWVVDVRISISLAATSLFWLACCRVSIYLPTVLGWIAPRYQSACHFFCSYLIRPRNQEAHLVVDTRALIRFASFGSCLSAAFLPIALFWADIAVLSLCCNYSNMPAKFAVHSAIPTQPPFHPLKTISPVLQLFANAHPPRGRPCNNNSSHFFYSLFLFLSFPPSSSFTNAPTAPLDPVDPSKTHNKDNSPTKSPTQTLSAAPIIS